jgi:hypothetical protein
VQSIPLKSDIEGISEAAPGTAANIERNVSLIVVTIVLEVDQYSFGKQ